jgi:AcrR family transcriptional regulator
VIAMTRKATPKSEATRARILDAALRVFRERGFQAATMREIAAEAGVALGAAYYYFESKDAIVMAFYQQAQQQMEPEIERILDSRRTLESRLRGLIGYKFEYFHPNRALMGALSAHIDPSHPLSPFSAATAYIRDRDIAFFARAVADSGVHLPPSILPYLPRLLWLYQMGLMLYWVYDSSAKQAHTALLFEKTLHMMLLLIKLAGIPLLRPLYRPAGELLKAIYEEA